LDRKKKLVFYFGVDYIEMQKISGSFNVMKYIFGPVPSRRLGYSLGVDVLPSQKTCNMNCIYCELGRGHKTFSRPSYCPPAEDIIFEVENYCVKNRDFDCVTVTASGEPTLHEDLPTILSNIKKLTSKPLVVLTNSSTLSKNSIRKALEQVDLVLPSLDAATVKGFRSINRPHPDLDIERIIEGLSNLRKTMRGQMWLEILLVSGMNDTTKELYALKDALSRIAPHKIQLNTVARPPAESWARPVPSSRLKEICKFFGKSAEIVIDFHTQMQRANKIILESEIMDTLKRRPLSLEDLRVLFGMYDGTETVLRRLLNNGIVQERHVKGRTFFVAINEHV